MPKYRAGNHHFAARPRAVRRHQQSASQPHVRPRGLCSRWSNVRVMGKGYRPTAGIAAGFCPQVTPKSLRLVRAVARALHRATRTMPGRFTTNHSAVSAPRRFALVRQTARNRGSSASPRPMLSPYTSAMTWTTASPGLVERDVTAGHPVEQRAGLVLTLRCGGRRGAECRSPRLGGPRGQGRGRRRWSKQPTPAARRLPAAPR
jgi:hypothetical protein